MSDKNYLCVFHVDETGNDLGLDPDFTSPVPTWGICRPNIRNTVDFGPNGSYLVFVAFEKTKKKYYLKGWFRVGRSLNYAEALGKFPNRKNVIIRKSKYQPELFIEKSKWKRRDIKKLLLYNNKSIVPQYLCCIRLQDGRILIQNPEDDHEIDNWKCQRIFRCRKKQLAKCINEDKCEKEADFLTVQGYIVADEKEWKDVGRDNIPWESVAPMSFKDRCLATPKRQHNALLLTIDDVNEIIAKGENRGLQKANEGSGK